MENEIRVLIPQFTDRAGRTVFNVHPWPEGRKTPGTVAETPVLGQMRIPADDQDDVIWEPAVRD